MSHNYLDTKKKDDAGFTWDWNIPQGYDFIESFLNSEVLGREENEEDAKRRTYELLADYRKPVLVKVADNHYCVAVGFAYDRNDGNHWVPLNTGWGQWAGEGYVPYQQIKKYWFFRGLRAHKSKRYIIQTYTPAGPAVCTTRSKDTGLYDKLWTFWLTPSRLVHYRTSVGHLPFNSINSISPTVSAPFGKCVYAPAVCSLDDRLYTATVDESSFIHVFMYDPKLKVWVDLHFPANTPTTIKPAICGGVQNWLTVVFCNNDGLQAVGNNADCVNIAGTWPTRIPTQSGKSYWNVVDAIGCREYLHLFEYKSRRITVYLRKDGNNKLTAMFCSRDGSDPIYTKSNITDLHTLCVRNKTVYGAVYGRLFRIHVSCNGQDSALSYIADEANLRDDIDDCTSLATMELEGGKHPQLVFAWKRHTYTPYTQDAYDAGLGSVGVRLLSTDHGDGSYNANSIYEVADAYDYTGCP
jgi:hypothetical protein